VAGNGFGNYLRGKRVAAKISLRNAAKAIGVSHVYLGEVERGDKPPPKHDRWADLARVIPGVTVEDLERHAQVAKPVQLSIGDAPPRYADLALALARRIESRNLSNRQLDELLELLGKKADD
jgi:transcriptional regulator with XRE-family HTH domain